MNTGTYSIGVGDTINNINYDGSEEMSFTYTHESESVSDKYYSLKSVALHISNNGVSIDSGGDGEFVIRLISHINLNGIYDVVIFRQDMSEVSDIIWEPNNPIKFSSYDVLKFEWTNPNNLTWGVILSTT
jgi:hypothetical protein